MNATEIRTECNPRRLLTPTNGLVWKGERMTRTASNGLVWEPLPLPEQGDTVDQGHFGMMRPTSIEEPTHLSVEGTTWGDYCGGMVQRSNWEALQRDYPGIFIDMTAHPGAHTLVLPLDVEVDEDLLDILVKIRDEYPLYDEEHHSALEMQLAEEAWEQYLGSDTISDLQKAGLHENLHNLDADSIRERYYELTGDQPSYPYGETADSVVFPHHNDVVKTLVAELNDVLHPLDRESDGRARKTPGGLCMITLTPSGSCECWEYDPATPVETRRRNLKAFVEYVKARR